MRTRQILLLFFFLCHNSFAQQKKPNIVVIMGDDIGWFNPSCYNMGMMGYRTPNIDRIAKEGAMFTDWYGQQSCTAKHLGTGQFYLMTPKDKNDQPFDGSKTYRLHLPANVPVKLYWSVTAYDRETHALIKDMKYASRASTTPGLQKNNDGSIDVYFGAKAPEGKESNWIPTNAHRQFELLARFYGPEKPFFDKIWKMGDVEEVK